MKILKNFGLVIFGLIIAVYILFLISPAIVSPILNGKSEFISEEIKKSTGFDSKLDGITFVTSWNFSAGLKVKELQLSLPESDKPFFYSKDIGIKLSLLPLLKKRLQLDSIFSDSVYADIIVKKDGSLELLDYLPEQTDEPKESFDLPMGIKLSNNLPSIYVNTYRLAVIDKRTERSYFMEGDDFRVTNFVLDKRVKLSSKGKIVFDDSVISNYDLKIDNRIMPNLQLHDLIFPSDVVLNDDVSKIKVQNNINLLNVIDLFNAVKNNQLRGNFVANIKTSGTVKSPKINGFVDFKNLSIAVKNNNLPEGYLKMKFKGDKTNIDSKFYTSVSDKNEITTLIGEVQSGKKSSVDLNFKSNAKFNNIISIVHSVAKTFGINDLETLSATGSVDANFKIKSDFKKVLSSGHLNILPSSFSYGRYNVNINDITSNINLDDNNINIKNAGFTILGQPLKLSGTILADTTTDLKLFANKLSIKGLLIALGQSSILKDNNVNSGVISLDVVLKGKLNEIKPKILATVENINLYNKSSNGKITLANAVADILYDGKNASGNIDINSFLLSITGANISVPKSLITISSDEIKIKDSSMFLNSSKVDITGSIKDYLNDKMSIDVLAKGSLQSSGIAAFLPKEFRNLITYKGQLPVKILINGNTKVQNIKADLSADRHNYISFVDLKELKGQNTKIHSNIEIIGDSLTLTNTTLANDKTTLATINGEVTKLYSNQKLNLNVTVPSQVSFPIWGIPSSNITANGNVHIVGDMLNPDVKGTVKIDDISIKNMDLIITNLTADLTGGMFNGNASAKGFKFGGIIASDLKGKFSLKDFSKFYLTDTTAKSFEGSVKGKLSYDISTTKIGAEFTGSGLNSTKAVEGAVGFKNALTGSMAFNGKLTMQGVTEKDIIKSLKGNMHFDVEEGRFIGIGRLENLVAAQNVTSNSILKAAISALSMASAIQEADKFKLVSGDLKFSNGTANISKIIVSGPSMAYHVKGSYNILHNSASLIILGRLDSKVVSVLGPLGQLSADKLLSYIPKIGAATSTLLKILTADPANEDTSLIPALTSGSTTYKDFKVIFNGAVESASSVKSFKWLSNCDTSEMNIKLDLENAQKAVKENITNRVEDAKTKIENVQKNVTNIVETQKQQAQQTKKDLEQTKEEIKNIKENVKQNSDNIKNLLQNAIKNSQQKVPSTQDIENANKNTEQEQKSETKIEQESSEQIQQTSP